MKNRLSQQEYLRKEYLQKEHVIFETIILDPHVRNIFIYF